jgi:hypothetical protein
MKNDQIPFAHLRKLLLDLGFEEARIRGPYWRFRHAPSGTLFVYRDYKPEDSILWHDFASTRLHLGPKQAFPPGSDVMTTLASM